MIKTLLHTTNATEPILRSGFLRSASMLGKSGTHGEDPDAIYFTPTDNKGIPVPHKNSFLSVFHLDAQKILKDFPMFFLNETNAFGPLDGQPHPRFGCKCRNTFSTLKTRKEGPCMHKTWEDIANMLVYDFNHCDGGPELGIYQEVPVDPYLLYITMPSTEYAKLSSEMKTKYETKIIVD